MKSAANLALHDGKRWECSERHPKVFPQSLLSLSRGQARPTYRHQLVLTLVCAGNWSSSATELAARPLCSASSRWATSQQ